VRPIPSSSHVPARHIVIECLHDDDGAESLRLIVRVSMTFNVSKLLAIPRCVERACSRHGIESNRPGRQTAYRGSWRC
jgi:hypothetical protein